MALPRREFLQKALTGFAAAQSVTTASVLTADEVRKPAFPIIDTHTHFYDPTRPQGVPWPSKDDPKLYRRVLPAEFQKLTNPYGVTGTVIVEASSWLEDNQWLLDLASDTPFIVGIVGNLAPGTEPFAAQLARFHKNPLYRGIRIGSDSLKEGLGRPVYMQDMRRLLEADLELDVNGGPEALPLVDQLAKQLPELRIVINHLSNVRIDGKEPPREWQQGMQAASRHKNVYMKVSALMESALGSGPKPPTTLDYYLPILNVTWKTFGADRVVYGSDWPVSDLAGDYGEGIKIVSLFFGDQGREAAEKFFNQNAKKAYKWPERK